jgi:hypothetical protein
LAGGVRTHGVFENHNKKARLSERVKQTIRTPQPERLREAEKRRREVKAMAYSLYPAQIDWVEQMALSLRKAGDPAANRSLVVREAILRLKEELDDKTPDDILDNFHARQKKRAKA